MSKPFLKGLPGGVLPSLLKMPGRTTGDAEAEFLEPGISKWATQQKPGPGRQDRESGAGWRGKGEQTREGTTEGRWFGTSSAPLSVHSQSGDSQHTLEQRLSNLLACDSQQENNFTSQPRPDTYIHTRPGFMGVQAGHLHQAPCSEGPHSWLSVLLLPS